MYFPCSVCTILEKCIINLDFFFTFLGSGLQKYLNEQGFNIVGFGCTTCIGNSGELDQSVASAISENGNWKSNIISIIEADSCAIIAVVFFITFR